MALGDSAGKSVTAGKGGAGETQPPENKLNQPAPGANAGSDANAGANPNPTNDADRREKLVTEFLGAGAGPQARTTSAELHEVEIEGAETDKPKPQPETGSLEKMLQEVERLRENLRLSGMPVETADQLARSAQQAQGRVSDWRAPTQMIERLNGMAKEGRLTEQATDVLSRIVEGNLEGKITLVTRENMEQTVKRPIFNVENPGYAQGTDLDTNCRACSASYIVNHLLPERALIAQFERLLDKLDAGQVKTTVIPLEGGMPKMSAVNYQNLYGNTHEGTAGQKYTESDMQRFREMNTTVHEYVVETLREAGFVEAKLPKLQWNSLNLPNKPGFYILEHPSAKSEAGESVQGHVTVAYVDEQGKFHRFDRQNPEIDASKLVVADIYQLNLEDASKESRVTVAGETRTRVQNGDGTFRDIKLAGSDVVAFTDIDGKEFSLNKDGRWQERRGTNWVETPLAAVDYLGTEKGIKYTFNNAGKSQTIVESPLGTVRVEIASDTPLRTADGNPLSVSGKTVMLGDIVNSIERPPNGKWQINFKNGTSISVDSPRPTDCESRSVKGLSTSVVGDGAASGIVGSGKQNTTELDRAIVQHLETESKGAGLDKAVVQLSSETSSGSDINRLSELENLLRRQGIATDPDTLRRYDTVMSQMRMGESQIADAKTIVDKVEKFLAQGKKLDGKVLTESLAIDLAIIESTINPDTGSKYSGQTALAQLRELESMRKVRPMTAAEGLENIRLRKTHKFYDSTLINEREGATVKKEFNIRQADELTKNPEGLKAAEEVHRTLGDPKLTLVDAYNIASIPELRANPQLGQEMLQDVGDTIRSTLNYKGQKGSTEHHTRNLLRVAMYMKENGLKPNSLRDVATAIQAVEALKDRPSVAATTNSGSPDVAQAENKTADTAPVPNKPEDVNKEVKPTADALIRVRPLDIEKLQEARDAYLRTRPERTEQGQRNVYDYLRKTLGEMQQSRQISKDWDVYPSEPGSPADKVGADYLLVNKKTGDFHILDATANPEKANVYQLRAGGVIFYEPFMFDEGGNLKLPADNAPKTDIADIEIKAQTFKTKVETQLGDLVDSPTPFNLKETPMPDFQKGSPAATKLQVERLTNWAHEQAEARKGGPVADLGAQFADMATVLERAVRFEEISSTQRPSPAFTSIIERTMLREVARFAFSRLKSEPYEERSRTDKSSVKYHGKSDTISLETEDGRFATTDATKVMTDSYTKLLDKGLLLSQLTAGQLRKLGVDPEAFTNKTEQGRLDAFNKAYNDRADKNHGQVKYAADQMLKKLMDLRTEIAAGGVAGDNTRKPILESVANALSNKPEGELLGTETTSATATATNDSGKASGRAGLELIRQMPAAAERLAWLHPDPVTGDKPSSAVASGMELLIEEQKSGEAKEKWSGSELEKFEKLKTAYDAGDSKAVEQVHDWLNHPNEVRTARESPEPRKEGSQAPVRPERELQSTARNVNRSAVETQGDGTRHIVDPESPVGKLDWQKRLTEDELKGLLEAKTALEEKQKTETLSAEEKSRLKSLRYLEANIGRPEVHQAVIEQVGSKRPSGGFTTAQLGSSVLALGILVTAILSIDEAELQVGKIKHRAGFGQTPL